MTHLYIEQNTGLTEEVNSSIISKLYELAISGDLDNTSDLKGRLHSTSGYGDQVSYLNTNFSDLYINVDKPYIRFQDPIAQQWCVTNFSTDGIGCSISDLAAVTNSDFNVSSFISSGIIYFNEFQYFTGMTLANFVTTNEENHNTTLKQITLPNTITRIGNTLTYGGGFLGYSALESIHIPSNCTIASAAFRYCTSLKSVSFGAGVTLEGDQQFKQCTSLTTVDLSGLTKLPSSIFGNCTSLTSIFIPNTVAEIGNSFAGVSGITSITFEEGGSTPLVLKGGTSGYKPGVFRMMSSQKIVFPERLSELKDNALGCTSAMTYVFTSTTPPSVTGNGQITADITNSKIYVPDSAVNTYKAATGFSDYASAIFPVSELPNS